MKPIYTKEAPEPIGPYSQAMVHNKTLYISGQIAIDGESGRMIQENIQDETRQVLKNIDAILNQAGSSKNQVIKCSIFILDMELFKPINEVYSEFFGLHKPARETVQVSALPGKANVEISAIASVD